MPAEPMRDRRRAGESRAGCCGERFEAPPERSRFASERGGEG
jgi:hypothetical protein